ncbi:MAG TPA: hypothetical protein VK459_08005 [Polyangiaceae bacterium]|nr:hypothetical protein [Polyangiaceae bacterium]
MTTGVSPSHVSTVQTLPSSGKSVGSITTLASPKTEHIVTLQSPGY